MKVPRCPGCKGRILDNDWTDHDECQRERTARETHPYEPRDR